MTEDGDGERGPKPWFEFGEGADADSLREALKGGGDGGSGALDLPRVAVDRGVFEDEQGYYDALHDAAVEVAEGRIEGAVDETERSLINAVRTLDTLGEGSNLLDERLRDWGEDGGPPTEVSDALGDAEDSLTAAEEEVRGYIQDTAPEVAPNLSNLAGELLAARLVALAGGLDELARMPSGTVQVLGAEDALFRHLSDGTPPPKHGAIYVHPYVRGTREEERGSAARAVAGKLTIAARVDRYSGDLRPGLNDELDEKVERIRSRGPGGEG